MTALILAIIKSLALTALLAYLHLWHGEGRSSHSVALRLFALVALALIAKKNASKLFEMLKRYANT